MKGGEKWTVSAHEDNGDVVIRDGDGDIIANCSVDSTDFSDTQVDAHAAAIVADHNSRADLLAACQLAAFQFDASARRFESEGLHCAAAIEDDNAAALRAAMVKAGA